MCATIQAIDGTAILTTDAWHSPPNYTRPSVHQRAHWMQVINIHTSTGPYWGCSVRTVVSTWIVLYFPLSLFLSLFLLSPLHRVIHWPALLLLLLLTYLTPLFLSFWLRLNVAQETDQTLWLCLHFCLCTYSSAHWKEEICLRWCIYCFLDPTFASRQFCSRVTPH